jgi:hypothetical protein
MLPLIGSPVDNVAVAAISSGPATWSGPPCRGRAARGPPHQALDVDAGLEEQVFERFDAAQHPVLEPQLRDPRRGFAAV